MRTWGIAIAGSVLVLSACGGDPEPTPDPTEDAVPSVAAGDCLDPGDGRRGLSPDMVTTEVVVDCDDPHSLEVVAVEDIPKKLSDDETATLDYRDDLLDVVTDPRGSDEEDMQEWVIETCANAYAETAGLDDIELRRKHAVSDFITYDGSTGVVAGFEFPEESWEERPRVVCVARFTEERELGEGSDEKPSRDVEGHTLAAYLTDEFPADMRHCLAAALDDSLSLTSCDKQHFVEYLFAFDADAVLDDDLLDEIDENLGSITPEIYAELDEICAQGFPGVLGEDYDADAVKGFAYLRSGWTGPSIWKRVVMCGVTAADSATYDLAPGSLIGADNSTIDVVPYRQQ